MNSLRTDDILGAKPTVRHMPKELIRERRPPHPYFPRVEQNNPEWHPEPQYPAYTKNERFSQLEYQNNDPTGMPFMPRHKLTKSPKYINYDFPQESRYEAPRGNQPQLMRAAS